MTALLAPAAILLCGAFGAVTASSWGRLSRLITLAAFTGAALVGVPLAVRTLQSGLTVETAVSWSLPGASFHLGLDPLSAFFLILILLVCVCAGWFGEGYLKAAHGHLPANTSRFFLLLLAAAMSLLVVARNALLFLVAWEVMALAAFFLVSTEHSQPATRRASLLYLLCTHTGSLCLLGLVGLLGHQAGSLEFDALAAAGAALPPLEHRAALVLAVVGFGMKAGFVPLHIWLQEAHPAAPSHASATMSGVMIEMGVYGLLRFFSFCAPVSLAWGVGFVVLGLTTAVSGILFAMVQTDGKRLLAYSSIENIGLILAGLGLGYAGLATRQPALAMLGFTGAILHTFNHGLFKSLLFLSAGSVAQALGTRNLEAGGGLLKRMPWTGLFTLVGAAAICGLPPLNGFTGELLLYGWLLRPQAVHAGLPASLAAACLALVGTLAVVAFTKAYGILFLGTPRTAAARSARDPNPLMLGSMALLAALCLGVGLVPAPALFAAAAAAATLTTAAPETVLAFREEWSSLLSVIAAVGAMVLAGGGLLWGLRAALLGSRRSGQVPTWGCGFTAATPRMQYSASSYSDRAARPFAALLGTHREVRAPLGYWPGPSSYRSETPDPVLDRWLPTLLVPVSAWISTGRRLQHGRLQFYLLYVSAALVILLLWKL